MQGGRQAGVETPDDGVRVGHAFAQTGKDLPLPDQAKEMGAEQRRPLQVEGPRQFRMEESLDPRLLVFAGRPAREKNIDSMVAAVERLGPPYKLLLVGAGKDVSWSPNVVSLDFERDPVRLATAASSTSTMPKSRRHSPASCRCSKSGRYVSSKIIPSPAMPARRR